MSDTYLTKDQLQTLFQSVTMVILGLDPTTWNAYQAALAAGTPWTGPIPANPYSTVRIAWQTSGAPSWAPGDDVVIVGVVERDHPYNRIRESQLSDIAGNPNHELNRAFHYTRVMEAQWTIYGPNSYDNSQAIRDGLFSDPAHATLKASNLFLTGAIVAPRRAPEIYPSPGGEWFERVDMQAMFNEIIIRNVTVPSIGSADVTILTDTGATENVTIT
jgi:hypothetical protein